MQHVYRYPLKSCTIRTQPPTTLRGGYPRLLLLAHQSQLEGVETGQVKCETEPGKYNTRLVVLTDELKLPRVRHDRDQTQSVRQNLVVDDRRVHEHVNVLDGHRGHLKDDR